MFWILPENKTDQPTFLTSMKKVGEFTKIEYATLAEHFSRKKLKFFNNGKFFIEKVSSVEEAMKSYAEKVSGPQEYIGDMIGEDGSRIKIYGSIEFKGSE